MLEEKAIACQEAKAREEEALAARRAQRREAPTDGGKEKGPQWALEDVLGGTFGISVESAVEGLQDSDSDDGEMVRQLRAQAKTVSEQLQAHVQQHMAPLIEELRKSKDKVEERRKLKKRKKEAGAEDGG